MKKSILYSYILFIIILAILSIITHLQIPDTNMTIVYIISGSAIVLGLGLIKFSKYILK